MDKNYSAWIHNDVDEGDDPVDGEPEPFWRRFQRPARSSVASGLLVTLIAAGVGGTAYSTWKPETSTTQQPTAESSTTPEDSGPGAAEIEDVPTDEPLTSEEPVTDETWVEPAEPAVSEESSDDSDSDDASDSSDDEFPSWSDEYRAPRIERRHVHPAMGVPPGHLPDHRPFHAPGPPPR